MNSAPGKNNWIRKAIWIVAVIQLVYLVVVNAALYIPATQALVSMIRPDRFVVSWDRAWTWYPFRVHVEGLSVNGQS